MQLSNPVFLVIGLFDGRFCGWNLQNNTFDYLPAHNCAVTVMSTTTILNQIYLMSGDQNGAVKVFNTKEF
jgi:hypothetical protein